MAKKPCREMTAPKATDKSPDTDKENKKSATSKPFVFFFPRPSGIRRANRPSPACAYNCPHCREGKVRMEVNDPAILGGQDREAPRMTTMSTSDRGPGSFSLGVGGEGANAQLLMIMPGGQRIQLG